jgi:hypothetical protein
MRTAVSSQFQFLGLFELDQNGKILYSDNSDYSTNNVRNLRGANFFGEVANGENASELLRRFEIFISAQSPACSFDFTFEHEDGPTEVRILMARLRKEPADYSFLLHIRRIPLTAVGGSFMPRLGSLTNNSDA